jgi:hypothetical protein
MPEPPVTKQQRAQIDQIEKQIEILTLFADLSFTWDESRQVLTARRFDEGDFGPSDHLYYEIDLPFEIGPALIILPKDAEYCKNLVLNPTDRIGEFWAESEALQHSDHSRAKHEREFVENERLYPLIEEYYNRLSAILPFGAYAIWQQLAKWLPQATDLPDSWTPEQRSTFLQDRLTKAYEGVSIIDGKPEIAVINVSLEDLFGSPIESLVPTSQDYGIQPWKTTEESEQFFYYPTLATTATIPFYKLSLTWESRSFELLFQSQQKIFPQSKSDFSLLDYYHTAYIKLLTEKYEQLRKAVSETMTIRLSIEMDFWVDGKITTDIRKKGEEQASEWVADGLKKICEESGVSSDRVRVTTET